VFSFAVGGGGGAGLNPDRAAYLALSYHTLCQVFPDVLAFPGEPVRFFASPSRGTLASDPEILVQRLQERRLELLYVREYYLMADLAPSRQQYVQAILQRQPVEVNTDLNPRGYFYDLILTGAREGLPLRGILRTLQKLPGFAAALALGLAFLLAWRLARRRPGLCALVQVLVMGLGTMALEVLTLVLYQVYLGYLYRQLGLLIAAFMLGLAVGGAWFARGQAEARLLARRLAGLQLGLAALSLGLFVVLLLSGKFLWLPPEMLVQAGLSLLLALAGFAGGGIFSLSAALWRKTRPAASLGAGLFYALDLFGATLGTLGLSLVILPLYGIIPALAGLAALHTGAAVMVAKR
jgi:spermidine synthase